MAKYCLKKQSKRLTCKKKFKIQCKVREHSRKLKKMTKEFGRKKSEKSIAVPNKCHFKAEVLMEAEQKRAEAKKMKQERKARQKTAKKGGANAKSVRSFAAEVRRTIENADIVIEASGSERKIGHQRAVKKKGAKQRKKMKKKKNTLWTDEASPPPNASLLGEEEEDNAVASPPPSVPISSRAIRKAVKRHKKNQQKIAKSADKLALQLDEKMEF
ncbi:hypothetical protein niasHT_037709 [Heterodera trifolii]|uniref:Guanine nucleotide-binding protein-like 3 N-terminal domain-containing protein n=1 Tax=Heterodera trifolii TaxID=157864 RepID=A0ABD2J0V3_9BILA